MDAAKYIDRRLHPVRVAIGLLSHELELAGSESMVTIDKDMLRSVVETTMLFVEDFDRSIGKLREKSNKHFVNTAAATKVG
ncbi:MAG TPA: hypothetical protein ENK43_06420 [Planctomycetes bacterium]|nr:hypothetical protein [Planctomycetota bacterium]